VHVQSSIGQHPEWGIRIAGFLDEGNAPLDPRIAADNVRKIVEIPDLLKEEVIDELILACPLSMLASLGPLVGVCAEAGVPVTLLSDLFGEYLPPPRVSQLGTLPALNFAPVHHDRLMIGVKRIVDVVGASALLIDPVHRLVVPEPGFRNPDENRSCRSAGDRGLKRMHWMSTGMRQALVFSPLGIV
jgi:hypothetical protein